MMLPDQLVGPRLVLRGWRGDHLAAVLDAIAASLAELRPWMPWAHELPSRHEELAVLREGRRRFDAGEDFPYSVFEHGSDEIVGAAGLHPRSDGVAEIGYWVRADRHRRGYATEAVRVLTDAAFTHLSALQTIEIRMDRANHASAAVPPKAGYTRTAEDPARERLAPGHTGRGWIWTLERTTWATDR